MNVMALGLRPAFDVGLPAWSTSFEAAAAAFPFVGVAVPVVAFVVDPLFDGLAIDLNFFIISFFATLSVSGAFGIPKGGASTPGATGNPGKAPGRVPGGNGTWGGILC